MSQPTRTKTPEHPNHPIVIDAFDAILYQAKGAISMHWSWSNKASSYFVVIQGWKDQTAPVLYFEMHIKAEKLPKNVAVFLSPDPKKLADMVHSYKFNKPKYARIRKKRSRAKTPPQEPTV